MKNTKVLLSLGQHYASHCTKSEEEAHTFPGVCFWLDQGSFGFEGRMSELGESPQHKKQNLMDRGGLVKMSANIYICILTYVYISHVLLRPGVLSQVTRGKHLLVFRRDYSFVLGALLWRYPSLRLSLSAKKKDTRYRVHVLLSGIFLSCVQIWSNYLRIIVLLDIITVV